MRLLISLFLALTISIWLGLRIVEDPGYLFLSYKTWTIEMPLWFAAVGILVCFIVIYFLIRTLSRIYNTPRYLRNWHQRNQFMKNYKALTQGIIELNEGDWQKAERYFLKSMRDDETAIVNYLGAAKAAQEQGDRQRRNKYIEKAQNIAPKEKSSIQLNLAQLQFESGQLEQALDTLHELQQSIPKHPKVLRLLKDIYIKLSEWENILQILPVLKKYGVIPKAEHNILEIMAHRGYLHSICEASDMEKLLDVWKIFPKHIQRHASVLSVFAEQLILRKRFEEAEKNLYSALKQSMDDDLIRLYGLCECENASKQLSKAEAWLRTEPHNPNLLLALGRIAVRNKLWGKARTYLENSLEYSPDPEAYSELAKLLDEIGESALAKEYFQKGLKQSLRNSAEIPLVGSDSD